jgi:hypothetical protein
VKAKSGSKIGVRRDSRGLEKRALGSGKNFENCCRAESAYVRRSAQPTI